MQEAYAELQSKLLVIGNLVHDSVPVHNDEVDLRFFSIYLAAHIIRLILFNNEVCLQANNAVVREWGAKRTEDKLKSHVDLVELLGIADLKKGTHSFSCYFLSSKTRSSYPV